MPHIRISQYVKTTLDNIKKAEGHKSYDSVIRSMLKNHRKLPLTRIVES